MAGLSPDLYGRLCRPLRLVALGNELLRGEVIDSNSAWLAARLAALDWRPDSMEQRSDHGGDAEAVLLRWREEGGVLILGGGLGPTPDDLTREAIAAGLGVELREHPAAAAMIRQREGELGRRFTEFTHRQALLPEGCSPIENRHGTAPAFWIEGQENRGFLLVLPGVPLEYRSSCEALFPEPERTGAEQWRLVGLGEDQLAKLLDDFPGHEDLGFYPSLEGHRLRVPLSLDRDALADRLREYLVSRQGETLETVLLGRLSARNETLAVAESCTGGLLGARITETPGASKVFLGGVLSYADRVKEQLLDVDPALIRVEGAVSEAVARAMAEGVRTRLGSNWALAVTGIAGPGGERPGKPVGTLHVALAGPAGTRHLHRVAGWDRRNNRRYAVLLALTLLWREIAQDAS